MKEDLMYSPKYDIGHEFHLPVRNSLLYPEAEDPICYLKIVGIYDNLYLFYIGNHICFYDRLYPYQGNLAPHWRKHELHACHSRSFDNKY